MLVVLVIIGSVCIGTAAAAIRSIKAQSVGSFHFVSIKVGRNSKRNNFALAHSSAPLTQTSLELISRKQLTRE